MQWKSSWWSRVSGAAVAVAVAVGCTDPLAPAFRFGGGDLSLQVLATIDLAAVPSAPARVDGATVAGDVLRLVIAVAGCDPREHRFGMVTSADLPSADPDDPPYTLFRLTHEAPEARCDTEHQVRLNVDLRPIQPVVSRSSTHKAVRFDIVEPGGLVAAVGELLYRWD